MNFFKRLFGKKAKEKEPVNNFTQEQYDEDYELKTTGLESVLGKMHGMVGHAIIPFAVGGAVDMYYFPNHINGTGFATMELLDPAGNGPLPNELGTYELVAFTKNELSESEKQQTPFNVIEREICGIFTKIGNYSTEAVLNPHDTCELPNGEGEENSCLVFDLYEPGGKSFMIGKRGHHLLLCLLVFRSEMEFAMENGTQNLLTRLKEAGYYPFSDLDREPVV